MQISWRSRTHRSEFIDQFVHQMVIKMLPKQFFCFPCVVGVTEIQPFHFVFDLWIENHINIQKSHLMDIHFTSVVEKKIKVATQTRKYPNLLLRRSIISPGNKFWKPHFSYVVDLTFTQIRARTHAYTLEFRTHQHKKNNRETRINIQSVKCEREENI